MSQPVSPITINFKVLPDKRLVAIVLEGNEEAGIFLVYVRFDKDIDFYVLRYYNDIRYKEDLTNDLYLHVRGKDGDWKPLRTFKWQCSLRTWFSSVISNLFLEKKKQLIDLGDVSTSIDTPEGEVIAKRFKQDERNNTQLVMLTEAINRLKNDEYRFILFKEIEGYTPKEIAKLLEDKRIQENRVKIRPDGRVITPTADYVYMVKAKALKEVKALVSEIKEEWYGN
jgi:RNA polymerase sigma factor (sigma-70 family)